MERRSRISNGRILSGSARFIGLVLSSWKEMLYFQFFFHSQKSVAKAFYDI